MRPGPNGPGAEVEDNLPLVDCDATWTAQPGRRAALGRHRGRDPRRAPRLETSRPAPAGSVDRSRRSPSTRASRRRGPIGRQFIAAEPLLEEGLSLALAFADAAGIKAALVTSR